MGLKHLALLAVLATSVYAIPNDRIDKSIGIFNIVKFPNDVCQSDQPTRLGTCFTAEECSSLNGVASGSCADGYGVCCVITLACGGTTSTNCTHLSQAPDANPNTDPGSADTCTYTICPASRTVNRIKLDITTFDIAGPAAGPTDGAAAGTADMGSTLGSCLTDRFSATGTSGGTYPIICGVNNDQHVIVDTDGTGCVTAVFAFGMGNAMRSYEIHVIQYNRLNQMGGPARCLQFYTGETGIVRTFNWQAQQAGTHLAFQAYDVCVRQEAGRCVLCWSPTGDAGTATTVGNFGISNGPSEAAAAKSGAGVVGCPGTDDTSDFIIIPNGLPATPTNILPGGALNRAEISPDVFDAPSRYCGRFLNENNEATDTTICTRLRQFSRLGVRFDTTEAVSDAPAADQLNTNEASGTDDPPGTLTSPLGTAGFELGFQQIAC